MRARSSSATCSANATSGVPNTSGPPPSRSAGEGRRRTAFGRRLIEGIQDRDQQIEREEQQQERFRAGEEIRPVLQRAPVRAAAEREGEADQVEHAPWAYPRDREDRGVEQRVVAEQRDVAALAGRDQDRGEEAA